MVLSSGNARCLLDRPTRNLLADHKQIIARRRGSMASSFSRSTLTSSSTLSPPFSPTWTLAASSSSSTPSPPWVTPQPVHHRHLDTNTMEEYRLPGELFDMDYQCQLVFGPQSRICPYMPVCKRLWCTFDTAGGCKTQHMPWADGTPCAEGKWCQQGKCLPIKLEEKKKIDGEWGEWSSFGPCSRTCGGGIRKSTRECDNPKPQNGGRYCLGERVKYESCNIQECPPGSPDFRAEQCASFDGQTFGIKGLKSDVKWAPHYTGGMYHLSVCSM